jgi:hypothetical protein
VAVANELEMIKSVGKGGVGWYTVLHPPQPENWPPCGVDVIKGVRMLHELIRLRGYPPFSTLVALNNLITLLRVDDEYFVLQCPPRVEYAENMVVLVPVDDRRPAFWVNLNAPVPQFRAPKGNKWVWKVVVEWRKQLRWQMQEIMRTVPLVLEFARGWRSIPAFAAADPNYPASLREARVGGRLGVYF